MKISGKLLIIFCLSLAVIGCQQKSEEHDHAHDEHEAGEEGANQVLYDEVMDIHDEVMPKMNDLYKTKTSLKTRAGLPDISESERQDLNEKIARIDSANEGMMVWMRQFDPIPDSEGEEKARAYLEAELIKVKKVREEILETLKNTQ